MPLFSVVIPTRNRIGLLRTTLASVFRQSFTDYEIVVVDDCSTDGSAAELAAAGLPIRLIQQPVQGGVSAARNTGVAAAKGDYIAFLDDDDLWMPWTLETYAAAAARHGGPAMISSNGEIFQDMDRAATIAQAPLQETAFSDYFDYSATTARPGWILPTGVVMRTDVARRGFDTGLYCYEDEDMWLQAGDAAGFVRIEQPLCWAYRTHAAGASAKLEPHFPTMRRVIAKERRGAYPGGQARRGQRREIISRLARYLARRAANEGFPMEAWRLYGTLLAWHLARGRWAFVLLFPAEAILAPLIRRRPGRVEPTAASTLSSQT